MASGRKKLLVIGFDGLDCELFKKRTPAGMDLWPLYAPIPITGPSWTSIYTGDSVATHGVRDVYGLEFRRRYSRNDALHLLRWHLHNLGRVLRGKPAHERVATYATTTSRYVWDTLGADGVTAKLVALPITCPVREVNGVQVGGFPVVRRSRWYWPDAIGPDIPHDYPQMVDVPHWFQDPERDSHRHWRQCLRQMGLAEASRRITDYAGRMVELFAALPGGELEMVQFPFIDRIGHVFGIAGQGQEFAYGLVGELIGRLIDLSRPDATLVVSDHGFRGDEHTDYGCLAAGRSIREAIKLPAGYTPSVLDVAPTVAAFFGHAHDCEGNNLLGGGEFVTRRSAQDLEDKAEITERLKDLGYL